MHSRMHAVLLFKGGRETRTNHDGGEGGKRKKINLEPIAYCKELFKIQMCKKL